MSGNRPECRLISILKQALTLANLSGVRILVVDDNDTSREMLDVRLAAWGMRPAGAKDGFTALHILAEAQEERDPYQVVILDLHLPGMDGAALGRAIKGDATLAGTCLVLLSSLGQRGDARRFEQMGFAAYLAKPLRHGDLFKVLAAVLGSQKGKTGDSTVLSEIQPIVTRHLAYEISMPSLNEAIHILLVEDNFTNQQVALGILKKFGLRADIAVNGIEALKILENSLYDLVLMDVHMPEMDGLEATRRIRDRQSSVLDHNIPVIAMTALAFSEDREHCLEAGMNDYISKPIEPNALARALERWLPGKKKENRVSVQEKKVQPEIKSKGDQSPIFDRAALLHRLMDDEDLAQIVIEGFLIDIPQQIQILKDCLECSDAEGAHRQAHTIKGAAANISGEALRRVAFEMEKYGKNGDLSAIQIHMIELEQQFEYLSKALKEKA